MIPRVVIDTNLYLSGIFFKGTPGQLLVLASNGDLRPVISPALVEELREKLLGRFRQPQEVADQFIQQLLDQSAFVTPNQTLSVCRDPDDDRILECAVRGQADFILSGDKDLLSIGSYDGIPILTVRQFLDSHLH
jgi:putative PIN family toxin of toxin-antitoxin system